MEIGDENSNEITFILHRAWWFGEILSHWEHFCGSELCLTMCSFRVYRLLSQVWQIWHWARSFRIEFSVWILRIWDNTSFRVVNVFAQYSQISVLTFLSASWIRSVWDLCSFSVKNLKANMELKSILIYCIFIHWMLSCISLAFDCNNHKGMFAPICPHETVYGHQGNIWTSISCRIDCKWIFLLQQLYVVTYERSDRFFLQMILHTYRICSDRNWHPFYISNLDKKNENVSFE